MVRLNPGDPIPITRNEADENFQSAIPSLTEYFAKQRRRNRGKVLFTAPGSNYGKPFIYNRADPRFQLTPEQLEWYYPASKNVQDWVYEDDHSGAGVAADKAFLSKLLPTKYPDDDYFEKEEMPLMLSTGSALRFPPIYFIRKF